jgi:TPR repeat protein
MGMKQVLVMMAAVFLVGCGNKDDGNIGEGEPSAIDRIEDPLPFSMPKKSSAGYVPPNPSKFLEIKTKAEAGDAKAQFDLCFMYGEGLGVPQNDEESVKWLRKAADQGNADAQNAIGGFYAFGMMPSIGKDPKEALKWLRKAIAQGHEIAPVHLESLLEEHPELRED